MTKKQSYEPWSDLNHDVLLLVMMKLEAVDFVSFSGVCKSWRSLALPNRKMFMESRPPMSMWFSTGLNEKACYLEDFEGRKFKTILPKFSFGRIFVGLTCGYLILFGMETRDFWLVNPITRHQLHFPGLPNDAPLHLDATLYLRIMGILVFSPSSGWLLVIAERYCDQIWFSIAGKGVWNHVSTTSQILDIHAIKGKIYILSMESFTCDVEQLYEMRLGPEPKLMLLKIENFPKTDLLPEFVSSGENLCLLQTYIPGKLYEVHELDFGKMTWVSCENKMEEYAFYICQMKGTTTAIKQESWACTETSRRGRFNDAYMWYFPHECLNVNLIDD